jgi:hypothetical protein
MIEKALAQEHVRASTYRQKIQLYHLCARPFYAALGQEDNRNRRRRQPRTIKNKLMGLDFVLAHREYRYLASEQEKLEYLTGQLQIPISALPTKLYRASKTDETSARYFVEKYPIFVQETPAPDSSPVVSFCFVDEGMTTLSHFETYLVQYGRLFALLPHFHLIYVAGIPALFEAAQRSFDRFLKTWRGNNGTALDPEIPRLLEHFEARRLYETKQFASFDRAKLIRLRNERAEFSGPKNDSLYQLWKTAGDGSVLEVLAPERGIRKPMDGRFSTYLLRHDYELFGQFKAF